MALDDIFRALAEQAESEIDEILQDARDRADAILAEAQEDAEQVKESRMSEVERSARAKAAQSINAARLESKKRVASAKQKAVVEVFDQAKEALKMVRSTKGYPELFRELAEEAGGTLAGEPEVLVDPVDMELAQSTFSKMDITVSLSSELSTAGGLVMTSDGGRIMRRNTLEERLGKASQMIQAEVAEILFS